MYSLTSAGVLAIDLARHPSGTAVAHAVDRVLALTGDDLQALDVREPAGHDVRERVLSRVQAPRVTTALVDLRAALAQGLPGRGAGDLLLAPLAGALLGGLADLHALVLREEPLVAAAPQARQVALDALTAAWAGRDADLGDLEQLRAPWAAALPGVPPSLPRRPWSDALDAVLDSLPHRSPVQWARSVRAHRRLRHGTRWSELMHDACWAAHRAGRVPDVARAHLAAARALRLSGASTGPESHVHSMLVVAAVQGVCLADVTDTRALLEAWEAGS